MWLISTETLAMKSVNDAEAYKYAILSHTWGNPDDEVIFSDMIDLEKARKKMMFSKIQKTCQLAHDRGIKWAWVDTCCIDKSSSAELTEAINSMFQWYKNSEICFVWLSDLSAAPSSAEACAWFTRGWTLQELIAPTKIEFYDEDWTLRGDKASLSKELSTATRVDREVLENSELISTISVAKRMSWAATRKTTRVEDMAYCLFGIFDVNLPLIYGEGPKAFTRLQEAIAAQNNDLSLFAWTSTDEKQVYRGIFSIAPAEFLRCGNLERIRNPAVKRPEFRLTNSGMKIICDIDQCDETGCYELSLDCFDSTLNESSDSDRTIVILLDKSAYGYVRYWPHKDTCPQEKPRSG